MKSLQQLLFLALVVIASANPFESTTPVSGKSIDPQCAKGMIFWCQNVINAKKCNAVDFCIKAVWETHRIKVDSNIICDDCKEWVAKARTFVENKDKSGEVVKSLKWTCDLIPLDYLAKSCEKVVDENVPEILRMLESKMDPDVVCSNLLICNNANYSKALLDQSSSSPKLLPFTCSQCQHVGALIESKFSQAQQDDVLEAFLKMCGEMSSYSDSCSSIVLTNFDDIYKGLRTNLKSKTMCELSASCLNNNYQREGIIDIVPPRIGNNSSIPCELCQQLALHLRELLITNTTEIELKNVMLGFCHQMGHFSNECINLAEQYSMDVFHFLADQLNANKMCKLIGICPTQLAMKELKMPTMPLVSREVFPHPSSRVIEVLGEFDESSLNLHEDGKLCTTCSYVIHFLQETLRKQSTEDEVVNLMRKTCNEFPKNLQGECKAFVELYGDTIVSLIDQGLDSRYICSKIELCPPNLTIDYLQKTAINEKPTCQFCALALQEVHDIIETNKTKQNIENAVSKLCDHLTNNLKSQCTEFVKKYANEVVEMLLADFSPQEACKFIKLCTDSHVEEKMDKIITNVDFLVDDKESVMNPQCQLCKEIVKIVEKRVINKKSKDEIRRELENSCSRLRKFSDKCKQFVDKYSDRVVDLITKELEPEEVCKELLFCVSSDEFESQDYDSGLEILMMASQAPAEEIKMQPQCVLCEFIIAKIESELNDTKTDAEIKNTVRNICSKLPSTIEKPCSQFVDYYFDMLIILIVTSPPNYVCADMKLCPAPAYNELMTKTMVEKIQHDVYKCALCKGLIETVNTIVEDPKADASLINIEEKFCLKYFGSYGPKCHDFAETYGKDIINKLKNLSNSDQVCYQMNLCSWSYPSGQANVE